jgi:ParB family chromosome partitioning protein
MATMNQHRMIPVAQIHPNPNNPRHEAGDVSDLARSIKVLVDQGRPALEQPLLVTPSPQFGGDHFMILDGYRRWVAGRTVVRSLECSIRYLREDEDPVQSALFTGLITSIHKLDLTALEKADAFGRMRDEFGMSQTDIAKQLGVTQTTISRYLSLLELSDQSRGLVVSGKLSVDKAVDAVKSHRAKDRKKTGKKPVDIGWEPDAFNPSHPLARKAKTMCDAREHGTRRRFAGACHACWETVIRQDEAKATKVDFMTAGSPDLQFLPPAILENGIAGVNGTTGNHD